MRKLSYEKKISLEIAYFVKSWLGPLGLKDVVRPITTRLP